jgi:squalene-hopene/tetraprenyl-beta-curcumene cyclase
MLKVCGHSPEADYMRRARERVLALGGLQAANSYTKINFSLVGLFPRKYTPTVPPEIVLVPLDILYEMSPGRALSSCRWPSVQAMGRTACPRTGITIEELYDPHKKLTLVNAREWRPCSAIWTVR